MLSETNRLLLKHDSHCKVYLGGSATTGRFTFLQDEKLVLVSDLDLYVEPSKCLSEISHVVENASYHVNTFEVSPSAKLGISCACSNCIANSVESSLLFQHCMEFGDDLNNWLTDPCFTNKKPRAYLPKRLGAAYCLIKAISYYNCNSDYNAHSALYQIYKFAESYDALSIEFDKLLWGRAICFSDFLRHIPDYISYFRSVLHQYLSKKSYLYICFVLDCINSSSDLIIEDRKYFESIVLELCGASANAVLDKKQNIDSYVYRSNNELSVHLLGS